MKQWWIRFGLFLDTEPQDAGCDRARDVVHAYVDLLSVGVDAPTRYPDAAEHFATCDSCGQILQGLVAAVHEHDTSAPRP